MNLCDLKVRWIDGLTLISWHAAARAHKGRIGVIPVEWNIVGCHGCLLFCENHIQFLKMKGIWKQFWDLFSKKIKKSGYTPF
jgi:hypothetical protein